MWVKSEPRIKERLKTDLTVAFQSRRRIIAFLAMLIVLIGAFILLRPRLWVKNKTAKVIVDGRLSEDVKLFHGSDDRLLFYLKSDPNHAYVYDRDNSAWRCESSYFASLKIIAVSRYKAVFGCALNGESLDNAHRELQSLAFDWHGQHVVVSWQAAPR
jgi:hypothetical protein